MIVKSVVYESFKKQNEKYATSSIAIKLHELATIVAEKCKDTEIATVIRANGDGLSKIVRSILNDHSDGSYKDVSVDIPGILKYNQPGFKY